MMDTDNFFAGAFKNAAEKAQNELFALRQVYYEAKSIILNRREFERVDDMYKPQIVATLNRLSAALEEVEKAGK